MPATRRGGVRSRPHPDWYSPELSAANLLVSACPGHFQAMGLYNNATDGTVLEVWALDLFSPTTSMFILLSFILGQQGSAIAGTYGAIDPLTSGLWGIVTTSGPAAKVGSNIGAFLMQQNVSRFISPGFPLARVQPGYTFLLQSNNAGAEIDCSMWWLPVKG